MNYLDWHYFEMWPKIILIWRNLMLFPFYFFGVPHHLSTLLAPWKRQTFAMKLGFHLDDFLSVITINFFSRIIGAIVRLFTVIFGLSFMIVFALIGLVPAIIWVVIPGFTLPFYLKRKLPAPFFIDKLLAKTDSNLSKIMLSLLQEEEGKFIISHLGFDRQSLYLYFLNQKDHGDIGLVQEFLSNKKRLLSVSDLFEAVAFRYPPFVNILEHEHLTGTDVKETGNWFERLQEIRNQPLYLDLERIRTIPAIGFDWAYGYTVTIDQYAQELTQKRVAFPILLGREQELASLERVLTKTERNNCLVAGEPGVARHRLVETFAHRIAAGYCPKILSHKRVLDLNMHAVISAKSSIPEVKGLFSEMLSEAQSAGNIILVIDEIDKYLSGKPGSVDLSDVIVKFAQSSVGLIGITTPSSYHRDIETNSSLAPLFEKIDIEQPDLPTLMMELELSIAPVLERKYQIIISFQALKKTVEDANRYISTTPFPAKAIELLDEACLYATTNLKQKLLTASHVEEVISEKYHMPIGDLAKNEKEKLVHLEELLHQRIINQQAAIRAIASSARRARLNITSPKRPIGSFLFLGPTGVGKTETAKALASIYFGSEDFLIRFDMSEYQKEEGLERLIGSLKLGTSGELSGKLTDRPYALLLLDEVEKADKQIENLLLTLLDEGYITNSLGNKINAKNTIIIATSNAGAEFIRESINKGTNGEDLTKTLIDFVLQEKIFSPEFLNRFDAVVVFSPLSEGHLREVARLMLEDLNTRLTDKNISVAITDKLINKLASIGFDPQFGARAIRRVITEIIEDQIAKRLLSSDVKRGESVEIEL